MCEGVIADIVVEVLCWRGW